MEKIKWRWIWIWGIKAGVAFVLEAAMTFLGDLHAPCAFLSINIPCGLTASILAVLLFFLLLGMVQLCWIGSAKIFTNLKQSIQKEHMSIFLRVFIGTIKKIQF